MKTFAPQKKKENSIFSGELDAEFSSIVNTFCFYETLFIKNKQAKETISC